METKKELKCAINAERAKYRKKIEDKFTQNKTKEVWEGMRRMSGYTNGSSKHSQLPDTSVEYANELNQFYNCLDEHNFSEEIDDLREILSDDHEAYDVEFPKKWFVMNSENKKFLKLPVPTTFRLKS